MRTCIELVKELHYQLRIMVEPINGLEIVFRGNMNVVNGASIP